jgi:hypothetical protein
MEDMVAVTDCIRMVVMADTAEGMAQDTAEGMAVMRDMAVMRQAVRGGSAVHTPAV